jgi:hypothetical protein
MTREQRTEALALAWAEAQKEANKLSKRVNKLVKEESSLGVFPVAYSVHSVKIELAKKMYEAAREIADRLWVEYNTEQFC